MTTIYPNVESTIEPTEEERLIAKLIDCLTKDLSYEEIGVHEASVTSDKEIKLDGDSATLGDVTVDVFLSYTIPEGNSEFL